MPRCPRVSDADTAQQRLLSSLIALGDINRSLLARRVPQEHVALRRQRRESHWARKPPTPDEVLLLHDLIRNHHLHRTAAHHHHQSQAGAVPMARTVLHSSYLMHRCAATTYDVRLLMRFVRQLQRGPGSWQEAVGT